MVVEGSRYWCILRMGFARQVAGERRGLILFRRSPPSTARVDISSIALQTSHPCFALGSSHILRVVFVQESRRGKAQRFHPLWGVRCKKSFRRHSQRCGLDKETTAAARRRGFVLLQECPSKQGSRRHLEQSILDIGGVFRVRFLVRLAHGFWEKSSRSKAQRLSLIHI